MVFAVLVTRSYQDGCPRKCMRLEDWCMRLETNLCEKDQSLPTSRVSLRYTVCGSISDVSLACATFYTVTGAQKHEIQLRFRSTLLIDQSVCTILAPTNRRIGFTHPRWLCLGRLVFSPSCTPASGANWLLFSIQKSTVEAGISFALKPLLIDRQLYGKLKVISSRERILVFRWRTQFFPSREISVIR